MLTSTPTLKTRIVKYIVLNSITVTAGLSKIDPLSVGIETDFLHSREVNPSQVLSLQSLTSGD